jgi:hypothetical protein
MSRARMNRLVAAPNADSKTFAIRSWFEKEYAVTLQKV